MLQHNAVIEERVADGGELAKSGHSDVLSGVIRASCTTQPIKQMDWPELRKRLASTGLSTGRRRSPRRRGYLASSIRVWGAVGLCESGLPVL